MNYTTEPGSDSVSMSSTGPHWEYAITDRPGRSRCSQPVWLGVSISGLAALCIAYLTGCGHKSEPAAPPANPVIKLEVLSAKMLQTERDNYVSLISLESTPIPGQSLPVSLERIRLLVFFVAGRVPRQELIEDLKLSQWNWNSRGTKSVPCGVEEIDAIEWHIETRGSYHAIRPAKPFTWRLDEVEELTFPLATAKEVGTAAVCVIGMAGIDQVIFMSDPVIVVLDPEKPDVSVTKRPQPIPPERKAKMQDAAEKMLGIVDCSIIEIVRAGMAASTKYEDTVKLSDLLRSVKSGTGALSTQDAFRQLLESAHVTSIQLTLIPITEEFVPFRRLSRNMAIQFQCLGTPERTSRGVYLIHERTGSGFSRVAERIPITWCHWTWLSAAMQDDGSCREMRIDTVARREKNPSRTP